MTSPARPLRRLGTTVLALAAGLSLVPTSTATAVPRLPAPTAEARAAGVEPGNAAMGWRPGATALRPSRRLDAGITAQKAFVPSGVLGIDVSSHQRSVNWATYARAG